MSNVKVEEKRRIFFDKEGNWLIDGEMVTHERLKLFLSKSLVKEDDKYYLKIGNQKVEVEVEDTPYIVKRVDYRNRKFLIHLNDETVEVLRPETLRMSKMNVLYCEVKDGIEARFSRSAYYQLAEYIGQDENGYYVTSEGKKYYIKE